jgi:hypothetical protein
MVGERGFQAPTPLVPNQILMLVGKCENFVGTHSSTPEFRAHPPISVAPPMFQSAMLWVAECTFMPQRLFS